MAQYAALPLSLSVEDHIGQPAESIVWTVEPYRPDAGYADRVAAALGLQGPGTVGDAPAGSVPWRVWLGPTVLAVNERTGDVLFFDPTADDGPRPNGPAQHDPAPDFARILSSLGTTIDLTPEPGRTPVFRGTDALSIAAPVMDGSWLGPGDRDGLALFATAPDPYDPIHYPGTTIYDADELGLITSKGRPVEIVHHPFGGLSGGAIYPITTYREAANELRANPNAHLRLLSAPLGEAVTLHVLPDGARIGSAWAGGPSTGLTRAGRTLVPVWEFLAEGTSASGQFARAMFVVDAVRPELRAPVASEALALDADGLLRRQLSVSVGGHQPWRMSVLETAKSELSGFGLPAATVPSIVMLDPDTASVTATDGQRTIGFTLRRAFPGLANSVWYLRDARK
ncbi:MAG TPA: hypothetical protein VKR80_07980 [Candidatus Limnocylindria bacterium]|nr:hypothetical protein [Candidatus Limnocylindria bacterium]